MGIHIYGNDPNQTLTVASGDISGNLVIFGNGAGDNVLAENGNISQNIIAFGNGAGGQVESPKWQRYSKCNHLWRQRR